MQINLKLSSLAVALILSLSSCTKINIPENSATGTQIKNATDRLEAIANRGRLICGVNGQLPGFSSVDKNGRYSGLDVDLCRAIAAAIFNDPDKVEFRNLDAQSRFTALKSGEVDLLSRNTTWTLSRDTDLGLEFAPTIFYDGQGILVNKTSNIENLEDLDGKSVCVLSETTNEQNLADRLRKVGLNYSPVAFDDVDRLYAAYEGRECEAITSDRSQLTIRQAELTKPEEHQLLDLILSKEPLGALVAEGDSKWFDAVKWITYAMIEAESLGIDSNNVDSFTRTENPQIRRFLGLEGNLGEDIGLPNNFTQRVIKNVGNYGEVYQRNIGIPFKLDRGLNALWSDGGLIYSPPFK